MLANQINTRHDATHKLNSCYHEAQCSKNKDATHESELICLCLGGCRGGSGQHGPTFQNRPDLSFDSGFASRCFANCWIHSEDSSREIKRDATGECEAY